MGQELEIIKSHQKENWDIRVITCNNILTACYFNPCHNITACTVCESRSKYWYKQMGLNSDQLLTLKRLPIEIEEFCVIDLSHLLSYRYKDMDLGRGAASSFISLTRDYKIDGKVEQHQKLINELLSMAINVVENMQAYIENEKPDKIVLFNGRFAESYPVICVAKKHHIEFETYETGSIVSKYQVFNQSLPHSIAFKNKLINELWSTADPEERNKIGESWYVNRRQGKVIKGKSFIGNQVKNELPQDFDPQKLNVAIFNSSEDELKVIEEYHTPLYDNQNQAIEQIVKFFENESNIHFYLRVHPNLGGVNNDQIQIINKWNFKNLTVLNPLDRIDTYFLMESCNKVLTFGSTTGIEATYWGRPSIIYGKSAYKPTHATYCPESFEELVTLIKDPELPPIPKHKALPYSYFLSSFGKELQYFSYKDTQNASFDGKPFTRLNKLSPIYFLRYLASLSVWSRMNKLVLGRGVKWNEIFKLKSHIDRKKIDLHS